MAAPACLNALTRASLRLPPLWTTHQRELGVGVLGVADQRVVQRPRRLLHTGDHDQPVAAEQGGRQDVGQLAHRQPAGRQLVLLRILVVGEDRGADRGDRAGAQQLLLPHHHAQAGGGFHGVGRHACMVSRGADTSPPVRGSAAAAARCRASPSRAATPHDAADPTTARSPPRSVRCTRIPARASQVSSRRVGMPVGVVGADRDRAPPGRRWPRGTPDRRPRCRGAEPSARPRPGRLPEARIRASARALRSPVNRIRTPRCVIRTTIDRSFASAAAVARSGAGASTSIVGRPDRPPVPGHQDRALARRCVGRGCRTRPPARRRARACRWRRSRPPDRPAHRPDRPRDRRPGATSGRAAATSIPSRSRHRSTARRPARRRPGRRPRVRSARRTRRPAPRRRRPRGRPAGGQPRTACRRGQPIATRPDQRGQRERAQPRETARAPTPPRAAGRSAGRRRRCRPAIPWPRPAPPRRARRRAPASGSASRRTRRGGPPTAGSAAPTTVAASPSTVAGATAGAASRLAGRETRLTVPERPATSGAVARPAAALTARASARTGQHPRVRSRRDQPGASSTIAAVAATERANPASRASPGSRSSSTQTAAPSAGSAARGRPAARASSVTAPMAAARTTLGLGPASTTKAIRRSPRRPPATRRSTARRRSGHSTAVEDDRHVRAGHRGEVGEPGALGSPRRAPGPWRACRRRPAPAAARPAAGSRTRPAEAASPSRSAPAARWSASGPAEQRRRAASRDHGDHVVARPRQRRAGPDPDRLARQQVAPALGGREEQHLGVQPVRRPTRRSRAVDGGVRDDPPSRGPGQHVRVAVQFEDERRTVRPASADGTQRRGLPRRPPGRPPSRWRRPARRGPPGRRPPRQPCRAGVPPPRPAPVVPPRPAPAAPG